MSAYEINKPVAVPDRILSVMTMLTHAAETGAPCPSNIEICKRIEAASPSRAADTIALLETMGLIAVERRSSQRRITITSSGKKTAPLKGTGRKVKRNVFPPKVIAMFADALAGGSSIDEATRRAGLTERQGSDAFYQIKQELGWQAQ